jgi:hypothetical protein
MRIFILIPASGYHLNDDVDDDQLSEKVSYNTSTLWIVRFMTCGYLFFAPASLYCIYNYQINDEKIKLISENIEDEADEVDGTDNDKKEERNVVQDAISTPMKTELIEHEIEESDLNNSKRSEKMNMSLHVTDLSDLVITMLNLSPVENRALASSQSTSKVFETISLFINVQFLLSIIASAMLMSLFIYVVNENSDTWTFLIVFMFLICSMCGLYSYYRFRALHTLKESNISMTEITDAAIDTETQRLNDKFTHVVLSDVKEDNLTSTMFKLDSSVGNPLFPGSPSSAAFAAQTTKSGPDDHQYTHDNYILENLVMCAGLICVIAVVAVAFDLKI